jgi:hypothetical protein
MLSGLRVGIIATAYAGGPWRVDDFPDPITQPLACGRNVSGWICDPDHLLSVSTANQVDQLLRDISTKTSVLCGAGRLAFHMGVAVLSDIATPGSKDASPDTSGLGSLSPQALARAVEGFSEQLGNAWAIGQDRCNNGVVLVLVSDTRVAVMKTGAGAREVMTDGNVIDILKDMRTALRTGDLSTAVLKGVTNVQLAMRGEYRRAPDIAVWVRVFVVVLASAGLLLLPAVLACVAYPFLRCGVLLRGPDRAPDPNKLSFLTPRGLFRMYIGSDDPSSPQLPVAVVAKDEL